MISVAKSLRAIVLASCLVAGGSSAIAQPAAKDPQLARDLERIREATLSSDYGYRFLSKLCYEVGPRLSGSAGAAASVELVADEMRKLGLKVTLQPVMVPHWERGEEKAEITEFVGQRRNVHHKLVVTALGSSGATPPEGLEATVVVVKNLEELETLGRSVEGKIVVFDLAFDDRVAKSGFSGRAYGQAVRARSSGPSLASKFGAKAALIRSVGGASFRLTHTGNTKFVDSQPIPAGALTSEDVDHIVYLSKQGPLKIKLTLTPKTYPDEPSFNVIGDLVGSEHPDEFVIASGHLDSWDLATGALDDAAGLATAMATVETFQKLGLKPKRTMRVIGWMNEENGLRGGTAYAKSFTDPTKQNFAAIELDSGAGHPIGWEVWAKPEWLAHLEPARLASEALGAGWLRPSTSAGADIGPLGTAGVPCFHPTQDGRTYFDYHHTPADTVDKVDPHLLQENSALIAVMSYTLCTVAKPQPTQPKP